MGSGVREQRSLEAGGRHPGVHAGVTMCEEALCVINVGTLSPLPCQHTGIHMSLVLCVYTWMCVPAYFHLGEPVCLCVS